MPIPLSLKQDIPQWIFGFMGYVKTQPERFRKLNEHFAPLQGTGNFHAVLNSFDQLKKKSFWMRDLNREVIEASRDFVEERYRIPTIFTENEPAGMEEYRTNGYHLFPQIASSKISAMREYFLNQPVMSEDMKSSQSLEEARSLKRNVAEVLPHLVFKSPHYLEFVSDPEVIGRVTRYLGATPTAIVATVWWSFAGQKIPKEAQLYHFDDADLKFCNYFVYLTDVDEKSGPHAYIPGTHRSEIVQKQLGRKTSDDELKKAYDWYQLQLRKSDREVEEFLGISPKIFTGPAGTNFLADTRAIHKGIVPLEADRLICQITYGLAPSLQQDFDPIRYEDLQIQFPHLATRFASSPHPYIFRFLVTPAGIQ